MSARDHVIPAQDLHVLQDEWDREAEALATAIDRAEDTVTGIAIPVLLAALAVLLIICTAAQVDGMLESGLAA